MTAMLIVVFGVFAVAAVLATLTFVWLDRRDERKYEGRHAFADPADVTDPDGAQFIAELHHEPPLTTPGRLPMLTPEELQVIAARFAEKFERKAARNTPTLFRPADTAPDRPAATSAAADTGEINIAVAEWGMTASEKAAELAAKYLTAPAVTR